MLILDKTGYIFKDEYLKMLTADNRIDALRTIIDKRFAPQLIKVAEENPILMERLLREVDAYHGNVLADLVEACRGCEEFARAVEGVIGVYSTIIALAEAQHSEKPLTYVFPGISARAIEETMAIGATPVRANPYVAKLLRNYLLKKKLQDADIQRIFDEIRHALALGKTFEERVVAGLLYDAVLMRMCTIGEFKGLAWRPLLLDPHDLDNVCKALETDIEAGLDVLRKTRPVYAVITEIVGNASDIVRGMQALDLAIAVAPAYLASQVLHVGTSSVFLRLYTFYLRQAVLLKLVLVVVGVSQLRDAVRSFIERWVSP